MPLVRQLAEVGGDAGCCGQITHITSGGFRVSCGSHVTVVVAMTGAKNGN